MTLCKPSISISRLIVTARGSEVYNQAFHSGVNIIRGENGSGKSTIADFIFYVLGGDIAAWKEAMLQCDHVQADIIINDSPITVRRHIEPASQQSMEIRFQGSDIWNTFPYKRSKYKESFTQVLFRALELPQVPGEESGNVTMHQLLRLIYADQMSPVEKLFRFEYHDPGLLRETVGDFLCGIYDPGLYTDQLRLREADRTLDTIVAQLRSFFALLGGVEDPLNDQWLMQKRQSLIQERDIVGENINALQSTQNNERSRTPAFDRQKSLIVELRDAAEEVSSLERQLAAIDLEIEDSSIFIRNLEANLIALEQSNVAIDSLGQIQFEFCPACFAEIVHPSSDVCSLCKTPTCKQRHSSNIHKMRQEISYQLRESNELQNARVRHREEL